MNDIAAAAGLSRPTVSLALSNKGTIAEATRRRVLDAARQLGFRPHAAAKAVVSGRSGMIGLLMSQVAVRSQLPSELLAGIDDKLADRDLHLLVARLDDDETVLGKPPRVLREVMCDGFLVNYQVEVPTALNSIILASQTPSVWLNDDGTHPGVRPDDLGGAKLAVNTLLGLGHRRIAYVDGLWNMHHRKGVVHSSRRQRLEGYRQAMNGAGLPEHVLLDDPRVPLDDYMASWSDLMGRIRQAISGSQPITGIITYGGEEPLVWEAAAHAGRQIPRDLSLITFGDLRSRREACLILPHRLMGLTAVQLLLDMIDGRQVDPERLIPLNLSPGFTLAPPPEPHEALLRHFA